MENSLTISIFFDSENVSADKVPVIIDFLASKGDILFQRAYADWSIDNTKSWKDQLNKIPITAIQQFHHNEKQAVDKLIMMDAIEMAIKHEEINTFAIIASDKGYHSLALRLRELGKKVIGIGEKKKSDSILVKSCNEFIYIEDLEEKDEDVLIKESETDKNDECLNDFALEKFIEKAFDSTPIYRNTNAVLLSQLWESVYRQKSDFNIRDYGVKSPRELIQKMNDKFKLSDDGKTPKTFFVEKLAVKDANKRLDGKVKRKIGNYRIITADDASGDYFFYMGEINPESKGKILEEGAKVSFLVVLKPNENSENKNGRATDVIAL